MNPDLPFAARACASILLALLVTTGCKGSRDTAREKPLASGSDELQLGDAGLSLLTDSGTVSLGPGATLPADLPKSIPVYPGAKVNMAARGAAGHGKSAWSLSLETGDDRAKVSQFYASGMAGAFTKTSDLNMGDTQMTIWQSAAYDVTLMVAAGMSDQTTITMTISAK